MNNYTVVLEVFKNKNKTNISWTPKYNTPEVKESGVKAANITGNAVEVNGLIGSNNEDLGKIIVGKRTTIAFTPKVAKQLLEQTLAIFKARQATGDKNPVLHIQVTAGRISPLPNTYYVANVSDVKIITDRQQSVDSDVFKAIAKVNNAQEQTNPRKKEYISNLVSILTTDVTKLVGKKAAK